MQALVGCDEDLTGLIDFGTVSTPAQAAHRVSEFLNASGAPAGVPSNKYLGLGAEKICPASIRPKSCRDGEASSWPSVHDRFYSRIPGCQRLAHGRSVVQFDSRGVRRIFERLFSGPVQFSAKDARRGPSPRFLTIPRSPRNRIRLEERSARTRLGVRA